MEKYTTISENNVIINGCSRGKSCFCDGSCKIIKSESLQQKLKPLQLLNNMQMELHKLDRFTTLNNSEMLEDLQGEYVLFSDVLNIFSLKNK